MSAVTRKAPRNRPARRLKDRPLTAREERFCEEYPSDLNATRAAKDSGFSAKSAAQIGYQLLHKPSVLRRLQEIQLSRMRALEVKGDQVLQELARIAFFDPRPAFGDDGSLKPIRQLPDAMAAAISSVEIEERFQGVGETREQVGFTKKVRFWPKVEALGLLGKHLRLFVDRLEVVDPQGIVKRMWEGRRRAGLKPR